MNNKIIEQYIQFAIDNGWENSVMSDLEIKKQIKPSHRFLERRLNINISYIGDNDIRKEFIINSDNLYKYIMKKEFIEAIAKGLQEDKNKLTTTSDFNGFGWEVRRMYYKNNILVDVEYLPYTKDQENGKEEIGDFYKLKSFSFNSLIVGITHNQADAIRDGKLEEFITNLGLGQENKG